MSDRNTTLTKHSAIIFSRIKKLIVQPLGFIVFKILSKVTIYPNPQLGHQNMKSKESSTAIIGAGGCHHWIHFSDLIMSRSGTHSAFCCCRDLLDTGVQ